MNNISCTLLEQLDKDLKVKFIIIGLNLGYSDDGILHYLRSRYDHTYAIPMHSEVNPVNGTGYVPAPIELTKTREELTREINERRLVSEPFPAEPKAYHGYAMYKRVTENPDLLNRFHHIYNTIRQHLNQTE